MNGYEISQTFVEAGIQTIPLNWYKRPKIEFADKPITSEFIKINDDVYKTAKGLGWLCRGYWCIDIDLHTGNGFESLKQSPYYDEIVANAKNTLIQTTPSGGRHLIFKKRKNIQYSQIIGYMDNVDIKAHHNNFFVTVGNYKAGTYQLNDREPVEYVGELEEVLFNPPERKYSVTNVLSGYDFSHLKGGSGGLGKQAYERIIQGQSLMRNQDLYLASTYAKQYGISLEPLKVLIGDVKNGDVFTAKEWEATVNSANVR